MCKFSKMNILFLKNGAEHFENYEQVSKYKNVFLRL